MAEVRQPSRSASIALANWRGDFDATKIYYRDDLLRYSGLVWRVLTVEITGVAPPALADTPSNTYEFVARASASGGTQMTGAEIVTAINTELGSTTWQGGAANLSATRNATSVTVTPSGGGTSAVIPAASAVDAGVMTAADKAKLDGIAPGADVNVGTDLSIAARGVTTLDIASSTGLDATVPAATQLLTGLMAAADKTKLDGIQAGAQVNVPTDLTLGTIGGVSIELLSSTGADVILPAANAAQAGLMSAADKVILDDLAISGIAFPPGHLAGLTLSNNSVDAVNDIDVAVGSARDNANTENMVLTSALTKRLDAAWVVGTNQGGLDTGVIGDGTYHLWLIKRSDTGVVDALFSLSATSPTMPTNYGAKRRIGSIIRASGAILGFRQSGDVFRLASERSIYSSTSPKASALTDMLVPTGVILRPILRYFQQQGTAGLFVSSLGDVAAGSANTDFATTSIASEAVAGILPSIWFTDTSAQLYHAVSTNSGTLAVNALLALGWIDSRGANSGGGGGGGGGTNLSLGTVDAVSVEIRSDTGTDAIIPAATAAAAGVATAAQITKLNGLEIGVTVQAFDQQLTDIAAAAVTDGNFIVGNGTTFIVESGATARASLGLGTMAVETAANYAALAGSQQFTNLNIFTTPAGTDLDTGIVGQITTLQVIQNTNGADALMAFHVSGDFATYFGLDGGLNDFVVGGWSFGSTTKHRIIHKGNQAILGSGTADATTFLRGDQTWAVPPGGVAATQAQQEAATDNTVMVTPAVQQFHPSAAKAWVRFNSAGTVAASYNITNVTDNGAGDWSINIGQDFSSVNYCGVAFSGRGAAATTDYSMACDAAPTAGIFHINRITGGVAADPSVVDAIFATFFGDQ